MGLLRRAAVRLTGNDGILPGSAEMAAEVASMLSREGIATRVSEGTDDDGMAFMVVDDVYGDTLAVVQGQPGAGGYLVVLAPMHADGDLGFAAWPGSGVLDSRDATASVMGLLSAAGLGPSGTPDGG